MIDTMSSGRSVLLVSSNGAGMGHLTRLLAYARRMPTGTRTHVVSLSQAVPVVQEHGLTWEYLPSQGATGLLPAAWRGLFADRMSEVLRRHDPDVMVFDGTHPYRGLDEALHSNPRTRSVWSRRGMWKPGLNVDQLKKSNWFDCVLEPGDLASTADRGATSGTGSAVRVRPVTLLDPSDLLPKEVARRKLGLPMHKPLALVSLGAGNINDTAGEVGAAAAALRQRGVGVCVTNPAIADRAYTDSDVHAVRRYPLSRYFHAFDYMITAAGYNSFHEAIRFGIPTAFVPNADTSLDDQVRRGEFAARSGWAVTTTTLTGDRGIDVVDELLDRGPAMARLGLSHDPGNGAADAAQIILTAAQASGGRAG